MVVNNKKLQQSINYVEDAVWVKCPNIHCGYVWYPNPRRWKDFGGVVGKKLQCNKCHSSLILPPAIVFRLRKQMGRTPEYGMGAKPDA